MKFMGYSLFGYAVLSICLVAFVGSSTANSDLPGLGDSSTNVLTPHKEDLIGAQLTRYLKSKKKIIDDPLVSEYIEALGNKLVSGSDHAGLMYHFYVLNDHTINAFAAPGKIIGIHSGLIEIAENESELAGVMAHEVAHITQNHLARLFQEQQRQALLTTVAMLAAVLVGDGELKKAAITSTIAGSAQASLNFTRANENEADHIGLRILTNAGFDPNSLPRFFERMQNASSIYGTRIPEFLQTHPVSNTRIADAKNRIAQLPTTKIQEDINFYLMRERIKVLSTPVPTKLISHYRNKLNTGSAFNRTGQRYGLILALLKTNQHAQAQQYLQPLLKQDPTRLAYLVADADIALAQRNAARVTAIYDTAIDFYPKSQAVVHYYVSALVQSGQAKRARDTVLRYKERDREYKFDAELHNLYSIACSRTGHLGEAYKHRAEYFYLNGQTKDAIDQLLLARKAEKLDEYLASSIEARLEQLRREFQLSKMK